MILRVIHSLAEEEAYRDVGWEGTEYPKVLAWYSADVPILPSFERKHDRPSEDQKDDVG